MEVQGREAWWKRWGLEVSWREEGKHLEVSGWQERRPMEAPRRETQVWSLTQFYFVGSLLLQCPLDIATLDIAAALPIPTSALVTDPRLYINNNIVYNVLKFRSLFSK